MDVDDLPLKREDPAERWHASVGFLDRFVVLGAKTSIFWVVEVILTPERGSGKFFNLDFIILLRFYQLPKRKSWETGLLTPPKETAAA